MQDDLAIPLCLKRAPSAQPIHLKLARLNKRRWSKPKIERPETAVLMDITLRDEVERLGCGRRLVWVREGRRWCKLAGLDGRKAKIPMALWGQILRTLRPRQGDL